MIPKSENYGFHRLSLSESSSVAMSESAKGVRAGCVISSYQEDDLEFADVEVPEEQDGSCSFDWLE